MSRDNNKESNKAKFAKDTITETLEENANLLLDQNLIYDLLHHGELQKHPETERVQKEILPHQIESIGLTEGLSIQNIRETIGGLDEAKLNQNHGSDPTKNLSPFCQVVLLELKTERQKSKDIESDLSIAKSYLTEARRELEVLRQRDAQRCQQIEESNKNIKDITVKCNHTSNVFAKDLEISQKQNKDLYAKNNLLENEKKVLTATVEDLREKITEWKNVQKDATSANERYSNALKENKILNEDLQKLGQKLQFFEVRSAKQSEEIEGLTYTIGALEDSLKQASGSGSHLQVEVEQLKERHAIVMQKALHAEEQMMDSITENTKLQNDMKGLQDEKSLLKKELHDFYKNKLHTVLAQSTGSMKTRIAVLETELKGKAAAETSKIAEMQKFFDEKLKSVVDRYASQVSTLAKKVTSLQEENVDLRQQREAVVRALSRHGPPETTVTSPEFIKDMPRTSHIDLNLFKEMQKSLSFEKYTLHTSDKASSHSAPSTGNTSPNKESLRQSNLDGIKLPPLITSTSLSSICASSEPHGHHPSNPGLPKESRRGRERARYRRKPIRATTPNRKPDVSKYTAMEVVDSFDTSGEFSSNVKFMSGPTTLPTVNREIGKLEREVSIISGIESSLEDPFDNSRSFTAYR